jgi:hypothetical protein
VITSLLENAVSWKIIKERDKPQRANLIYPHSRLRAMSAWEAP